MAPDDFRIHYDFNGNRTIAAVLPLIKELEKHPIVGFIEDPLRRDDVEGYKRLREKTNIPLIMHVPKLGGLQEALMGAADIYMLGTDVGSTLTKGFAFAELNIQTLIQLTGGTLTKALALHMAAVLPTCSAHSIHLDDQYDEDVTTERIPVIEGFSPVPEGPGLGVEVDEAAIAHAAANKPFEVPRFLSKLTLPGGTKIVTPSFPSVPRLTGREEGCMRGLKTEIWEDDGSVEFNKFYEKAVKEGQIFED